MRREPCIRRLIPTKAAYLRRLRLLTNAKLPDALRLSGLRVSCNILNLHSFVGRIRRSRRIRHKQSALCKSFEAAQLRRLPSGRNFVNLRNA